MRPADAEGTVCSVDPKEQSDLYCLFRYIFPNTENFMATFFQASSLSHAKDLTDYAQKWADHLVATNSFQHSDCNHKGQKLGENIAMKWSSRPDAYTGWFEIFSGKLVLC